MRPNLFSYATSELSQDAFLCWLLSWGSPEAPNEVLREVGVELRLALCAKAGVEAPAIVDKLTVCHQEDGIDILCLVNDDLALIIEDKAGTHQHSNQLARYLETVKSKYPSRAIVPIYVQTGDQGDYREVVRAGYHAFTRVDLLRLFESPRAIVASQRSDILRDYTAHLRRIEDRIQSYRSLPLNKWTRDSWIGFYCALQNALGSGHWGYVANAAGGFMGYWWHATGDEQCERYLQLEHEDLCFRVSCPSAGRVASPLANTWSRRVIGACSDHGLRAVRPRRIRSGVTTCIAALEGDYRAADDNSLIDMDQTVQLLRRAEEVLDSLQE